MTVQVSWSEWLPLEKDSVRKIPQTPGVYEISCQAATCSLYIGRATGQDGLRQRLSGRIDSPKDNLSGHEKRLRSQGCSFLFRYIKTDSTSEAEHLEAVIIDKYWKHHGHLPHGNTQKPRKALLTKP